MPTTTSARHLQRKFFPRRDHDSLGLKPFPCIDAFVVSPWPVDTLVHQWFVALRGLECLDHVFYALGVLFAGDQNRIRGFDDDHVLDTDRRNQAAVCADVGILDPVKVHIAGRHVARPVGLDCLP